MAIFRDFLKKIYKFANFDNDPLLNIITGGGYGSNPINGAGVVSADAQSPIPPYSRQSIELWQDRNKAFNLARYHPLIHNVVEKIILRTIGNETHNLSFSNLVPQDVQSVIRDRWQRYQKRSDISVKGLKLADLEKSALRHVLVDGDAFLIKTASGYRLIPGRAVYNSSGGGYATLPNGAGIIAGGVEFNTDGKPVAYHFTPNNEMLGGITGQQTIMGNTQRLLAEQVSHIYKYVREDEPRGYPYFLPALFVADVAYQAHSAYVSKLALSSSMFLAAKKDPNYTAPTNLSVPIQTLNDKTKINSQNVNNSGSNNPLDGFLRTTTNNVPFNRTLIAHEGYEFTALNNGSSSAEFIEFMKLCNEYLAGSFKMAGFEVTNDMSRVNFSSARMAWQMSKTIYENLQSLICDKLTRVIYNDFLSELINNGDIKLPFGLGRNEMADLLFDLRNPVFSWQRCQVQEIERIIIPLMNAVADGGLTWEEMRREIGQHDNLVEFLQDKSREIEMFNKFGVQYPTKMNEPSVHGAEIVSGMSGSDPKKENDKKNEE